MHTVEELQKRIIELCLQVAEMRAKLEMHEGQITWFRDVLKTLIMEKQK